MGSILKLIIKQELFVLQYNNQEKIQYKSGADSVVQSLG